MTRKLPVFLVSGYLGSGKTSFISHFISDFRPRKLAIIENEFGTLALDAILLQKDAVVFEIINGCVCCSVQNDLLETLDQINMQSNQFDALLIEATGIADPSSILNAFYTEQNKQRFEVFQLIVLVDLVNFRANYQNNKDLTRQIVLADTFVLNKADLVDQAEISAVKNLLSNINADAAMHVATKGKTSETWDSSKIHLQSNAKPINFSQFTLDAQANHGVEFLSFQFEGLLSEEQFHQWLDYFLGLYPQIYRLKAVICFDSYQKYSVQAVARHAETSFLNYLSAEKTLNQIVLIGKQLPKDQIEQDVEYLMHNFVQ